jgi:hypothetical protein
VVGGLKKLSDGLESSLPDLHRHARIGEQILGPGRAIRGRDEDRAVGLLDVADRHRPRQPRPSADRRDPGDLAREDQIAPDGVRGRGSEAVQPSSPLVS